MMAKMVAVVVVLFFFKPGLNPAGTNLKSTMTICIKSAFGGKSFGKEKPNKILRRTKAT